MSGREVFGKLVKAITLFARIVSVLPRPFRRWLLRVNRNTGGNVGIFIRYILIRHLAGRCGDNVCIRQYVILENIDKISFGNNVSIHPFCYLDGKGTIEIGNEVSIAHGSSVLSTNHTWASRDIPIKYNPVSLRKVVIDESVWIGCGCRILAGVHIGKRSVVAAGAVVTKDVGSHEIVGGIPARHIKSI